jgi:hypothetical protein
MMAKNRIGSRRRVMVTAGDPLRDQLGGRAFESRPRQYPEWEALPQNQIPSFRIGIQQTIP